jgi:hypothetical protein
MAATTSRKARRTLGWYQRLRSINLTEIDVTNDEELSRMSCMAQYEKDRAAINDSNNSVAPKV